MSRAAGPASAVAPSLVAAVFVIIALSSAAALVIPTTGAAQVAGTPPVAPAPAPLPPIDVSPGGAFWRALLVPGWGHVAIGSHTRGGVYFAAQSATLYTLLRTRSRIGEVQDRVRLREAVLRSRLEQAGPADPEDIEAAFDDDDALTDLRGLLDSRKEQQEDLVALGIFLLFLSGADAYVSAHLARFPEPLELEANAAPGGGYELVLRVRLPN